MAKLTSEIIEKLKEEAEKIEYGQITITFNPANEFITISTKNDKRIHNKNYSGGFRKG